MDISTVFSHILIFSLSHPPVSTVLPYVSVVVWLVDALPLDLGPAGYIVLSRSLHWAPHCAREDKHNSSTQSRQQFSIALNHMKEQVTPKNM